MHFILRGPLSPETATVRNVPWTHLVHAADPADDLDIEEHLLLLVPEPIRELLQQFPSSAAAKPATFLIHGNRVNMLEHGYIFGIVRCE
jgi:hypothetical protein